MRLYKIRVLGKNQNPRKILLRTLHYSYYSILHNTSSTCTFAVNLFITSLYNRTDSLLSVINHVVPENVMPISSNQDEDEELQKDLDNIIKIYTPFDQWQIIMTQPMDEIGELKFTGNKNSVYGKSRDFIKIRSRDFYVQYIAEKVNYKKFP